MCSLMGFGELNIPSSRAFWDDCDEDDTTSQDNFKELSLGFESGQTVTALSSDIFVIIEGPSIKEFAEKSLLQGAVKIAQIPTEKTGSVLYSIKAKNMLLAILEEDLTNSGEITELLLPFVELAKTVVTLTLKSKVDFKSENIGEVREKIVFIRGINANLKHIRELEAPNFIVGVASGVASWRDNRNLDIASYVAFTDKIPLDTLAAQPILKLLSELGMECSKSYIPTPHDDSYLYL